MSKRSPGEVVRSFWSAFSSGRFDELFGELVSPDCEFVMPGMPPLRGHAPMRQLFEAYARAFPDFRCQTLSAVEDAQCYLAEARYTGTHRAPLATPQGELPPSGRPVSWVSADVVRVEAGRIVSWHVYHDSIAILTQLGVARG